MPGLVIGSSQSVIGEAWIGATDAAQLGDTVAPALVLNGSVYPEQRAAFVYKPNALAPGAAVAAPSVHRTAKPQSWSNTPILQTPRLAQLIKGDAFANTQSFFALHLRRSVQASSHANGATIAGPRLALRIAPAAFPNASQLYIAGIAQSSGAKLAPHVASTANAFAPTVAPATTTSITVTLSLPGLIPRAPKPLQRRPAATWPNLPQVAAPPWRLTLVTPDLARERARERMAALKRSERLRRKRKADERTNEIVNALIDETVVRTFVDVIAKAG
jgi:hypothetical protein